MGQSIHKMMVYYEGIYGIVDVEELFYLIDMTPQELFRLKGSFWGHILGSDLPIDIRKSSDYLGVWRETPELNIQVLFTTRSPVEARDE